MLTDWTDSWVAVVDDDRSMRSCIARALRLDGIRAEVFESAEDYLENSPLSAPRCLVLDMQLPGMQGRDLAKFLERERPPLPPTIFITGHHDLLASLDGCCAAYGRLKKPFDITELLALVEATLVRPGCCGEAALQRAMQAD